MSQTSWLKCPSVYFRWVCVQENEFIIIVFVYVGVLYSRFSLIDNPEFTHIVFTILMKNFLVGLSSTDQFVIFVQDEQVMCTQKNKDVLFPFSLKTVTVEINKQITLLLYVEDRVIPSDWDSVRWLLTSFLLQINWTLFPRENHFTQWDFHCLTPSRTSICLVPSLDRKW